MLVLANSNTNGARAFRNVYGLDTANVNSLNLLHLAPGGHLGRFIIWTKAAFQQLDKIFGTFTQESEVKRGFVLPASMVTNNDITRIIRSEEVRRALTPKKLAAKKASTFTQPRNGMRNRRLRLRPPRHQEDWQEVNENSKKYNQESLFIISFFLYPKSYYY